MNRYAVYSTVTAYLTFALCGDFWVGHVHGFGADLGFCRDEKFDCECGAGSGKTFPVYQKQCNFVSNWQVWCRSCENGVEVYKEDVCAKYQPCAECHPGLKACKSCPSGHFGQWCDQKCECLNGGTCVGSGSNCICPPEFKGPYCEQKTGCDVPPTTGLLRVTRIPERNPSVLEFKCPENGFVLRGSSHLNCDLATGLWTGSPPTCVTVCPVPETPANCEVVGIPDNGPITSGHNLQFRCKKGYTLVGHSETRCANDSTWTGQAPSCVKLVFCRKPLPEHHLAYRVLNPHSSALFSNGTELSFECTDGRFLLGAATVTCHGNGKWSNDLPTCVKVHASEVNCRTRGYEVMSDVGHQVRSEATSWNLFAVALCHSSVC